MRDFPKFLATKKDVLNVITEFPIQTKEYLTKLLNERKYYNDDREYVDNPNAALFRMGFTTEEAISYLDAYTEPPIPDPPMTEEEREVAELQAWRETADCSRLQAILALEESGILSDVETWINHESTSSVIKIVYREAYRFSRNSQLFDHFKTAFSVDDEYIDDLFRLAQSKTV